MARCSRSLTLAWRLPADDARARRAAARPDVGPAPDALLSTAEAAQVAGVAESTIRGWVRRGLLAPAATVNGRHRFVPLDVAKAHHASMRKRR